MPKVNCVNGKCVHCGECCGASPMPLTLKEYHIIADYIKENNIKETPPTRKGNDVRIECCFRDVENKRCKIYDIRPKICKKFKCCNSMDKIEEDKKITHQEAYFNKIDKKGELFNVTNFSVLFYQNYDPLLMILRHYFRDNFKTEQEFQRYIVNYLKEYGYKGGKI